jgi:signal transduction histidine kinase
MEERTEALGGKMHIRSKRGKGTRVLVEAPLAE